MGEGIVGTVYLLHFDRPLGNERKQARHYVGWTIDETPDRRLEEHRRSRVATYDPKRDAKIMCWANERGITYDVVRTWEADRNFEKKLKRAGHFDRLCPICRPHALAKHRAGMREHYRKETTNV